MVILLALVVPAMAQEQTRPTHWGGQGGQMPNRPAKSAHWGAAGKMPERKAMKNH